MTWEFFTDAEFAAKLDWARAFVREEIWPIETIEDSLDTEALDEIYAPLQARVKAEGLWAAHLSPELGGQGFGQVKLGLLNEILGTSTRWAPRAFGCNPPDSGNSEVLALAGTPEQKEQWLRPLLAGRIKSAFSMTEPATAGADPTLLATRAVRDGDDYVIEGTKWFTSEGSVADVLIVMAVTDPEAAKHRRASMFIVPVDTPGVTIVRDIPTMERPYEMFGRHGGHAEVQYDSVRIPAANILGAEGDGFAIAQHRLGPGRIHHCMRWLGVSSRAFDMMCERATYRESHGSVLAEKQTVQNWIADSAAEMQAARLMTLHAAWVIDTHGVDAARNDIGMIKYFGAKVMHDVVDRSLQVHGALGYSGDMPLEAMYRDARGARIYDGPDEVHRQSVARRILRGFTAPVELVPTQHVPARRLAAELSFASHLRDSARRLADVPSTVGVGPHG